MKLFPQINPHSNFLLLHADLDWLVAWGVYFDLTLNTLKCLVMTFSNLKSSLSFPYSIKDIPFPIAGNSICDLAVFSLTKNVSPLLRIETVANFLVKLLDFVSCTSWDFHLLSSLKQLYCALIRLILQYSSVLWHPNSFFTSDMIEWVQRRFLQISAYSLKIPCPPHDFSPVLLALGRSPFTFWS